MNMKMRCEMAWRAAAEFSPVHSISRDAIFDDYSSSKHIFQSFYSLRDVELSCEKVKTNERCNNNQPKYYINKVPRMWCKEEEEKKTSLKNIFRHKFMIFDWAHTPVQRSYIHILVIFRDCQMIWSPKHVHFTRCFCGFYIIFNAKHYTNIGSFLAQISTHQHPNR